MRNAIKQRFSVFTDIFQPGVCQRTPCGGSFGQTHLPTSPEYPQAAVVLIVVLSWLFNFYYYFCGVLKCIQKKMNNDYSNLIDKTFLDFNPSDEAIDYVLSGGEDKHTQEDIDDYLEIIESGVGLRYRVIGFSFFAAFTKNAELLKATQEQFGKYFPWLLKKTL